MNSREYVSRLLQNEYTKDEKSYRKMLESTRAIIDPKMTDED